MDDGGPAPAEERRLARTRHPVLGGEHEDGGREAGGQER
jgi:hypothetical protein